MRTIPYQVSPEEYFANDEIQEVPTKKAIQRNIIVPNNHTASVDPNFLLGIIAVAGMLSLAIVFIATRKKS